MLITSTVEQLHIFQMAGLSKHQSVVLESVSTVEAQQNA